MLFLVPAQVGCWSSASGEAGDRDGGLEFDGHDDSVADVAGADHQPDEDRWDAVAEEETGDIADGPDTDVADDGRDDSPSVSLYGTLYATDWTGPLEPDPCPPPSWVVPSVSWLVDRPFRVVGTAEVRPSEGHPCLARARHERGGLILIGLGGHSSSDETFPDVEERPLLHATLAANVVALLTGSSYDGVELDCVGGDCPAPIGPLARTIREAMDGSRAGLLLTLVLPLDPEAPARGTSSSGFADLHDPAGLDDAVDLFVLRAMDGWGTQMGFHCGDWAPAHTGQAFPLWTPSTDPCRAAGRTASISDSVGAWARRGVPRDKIVIPATFVGMESTGIVLYAARTPGYCPWTRFGHESPWVPGTVTELLGDSAWTRLWDAEAGVPYLVSESLVRMVSYEDEESIRLKCEFAHDNRVAGVALDRLGADLNEGTGATPLVDAAVRACGSRP